jgi:prepilin-type N-terminal cleavage/methylation domain-containing protein
MMSTQEHMKNHKGFSLVELLVALAIGFVVILGVSGIFVNSRQNYSAQDESSKFQENIRLASELVSRTLKHAGHRAPSLTDASTDTEAAPLNRTSKIVEGVSSTEGLATTVGSQDTVTVRYQGNGLVTQAGAAAGVITDCLGSSVGTVRIAPDIYAPIVFNTFAVQQVNGRPWLVCSTGIRSTTVGSDPVVAAVPLIPDVEGIEVLYGIFENPATGADPSPGTVSRYARSSDNPPRERISAIRVFLLMRSEADVSPITDTQTYTLAEKTYGPFNDRRVRRVVEISAALRNWNP